MIPDPKWPVRSDLPLPAGKLDRLVRRILARILKLPVIYERVPIQNGLKSSRMG